MHKLKRLNEAEESENYDLNIDEAILDALVDLVGSEEDVEAAAEEAYNDLMTAMDNDEVEVEEDSVPEKLAISALVVKLVELGMLGPSDADEFIEENL